MALSRFSAYEEWRAGLEQVEYVSGIYVEVRSRNGRDQLVGVLYVDSAARTADAIAMRVEAAWPELHRTLQALERLNTPSAPAYVVFTDNNLSSFRVYRSPFARHTFTDYGRSPFARLIEGLGDARMTGRTPRPPRYPAALPPYSRWHYGLDWACKCRDLDYAEIRPAADGDWRFAAFLEVTGNLRAESDIEVATQRSHPQCIFKRLSLQRTILLALSTRFGAPAFLVIHTTDLSRFRVYDLDYRLLLRLGLGEYEAWLAGL